MHGHGISWNFSSQVPVFTVPLKFKSCHFGPCLCHNQDSTFGSSSMSFGICRGDSSWIPMSQGTHWAVRMLITWSEISYIGRDQIECQLWFPGQTPLDYARDRNHTEIVNLMMGKASWLRGWGRRTAASQWHSRWTCQRMKHGWTASAGGDKNMKRGGDRVSSHKGCLHIRFSTNESLTPIAASSSKTTGQQLSTNQPRIWLNQQNWPRTQHGILLVETPCHPFNFCGLQEQIRLSD